jgi:hypothetical protein
LFTVDVFPAESATSKDLYRIEIVMELVNGGLWDSTDEIGDQLRYRICRPTREAAEVVAGELVAMRLNAAVKVGSPELEAANVASPKTHRRRTRATLTSGA